MSSSDSEDTTMAQTKKGAVADQKPKRPLSGYMRFCQEKRAEVKTANPSMGAKEILSEMGKMWKELPQAEKDTYNDAYNKEKKEFDEKLAAWKAEHPEEEKKEKEAKKAKKAKKAAKKDSKKDTKKDTKKKDTKKKAAKKVESEEEIEEDEEESIPEESEPEESLPDEEESEEEEIEEEVVEESD